MGAGTRVPASNDNTNNLLLDEYVQTCDVFILLNGTHLEVVPETQWPFKEH